MVAVVLRGEPGSSTGLLDARGLNQSYDTLAVPGIGGEQGEHAGVVTAYPVEGIGDVVGKVVVAHGDSVRVPAVALQGFGNRPGTKTG